MVCVASGDIVGPVYEDFTYARLNRKDFRDVPGMVMALWSKGLARPTPQCYRTITDRTVMMAGLA